jgi:hypothetical protein
VAWLAEQVLTRDVPPRRRRLDTISFAQRTFAGVPERAFDDVVTTLAEFGRLQALMLTLDRLKIADPAIYAAAARRAATLDRLDRSHAFRSLAQFQSALTFVVQLRRGRTIDRAVTERLVQSLVSLDVHDDGYRCGMAAWIDEALMPSLPRAEDASASLEGRLLAAMSGVGSTASPQVSDVAWEGQMYRLDLAGAEMRRMAQVRSKQRGKSLDDAMAFARDARGRARTGEAMRACDEMVGRVLISLAYAIHLGDGEGTVLLGGDVSQRHDFGLTSPVAEVRRRTPWATPDPQSQAGVPWHVSGSVLALDVGLSSLALRSVSGGGIADRADVIKDFDRKAFSDSVALLDPLDLTEDARAGIVAALARGRARIARLEDHPEEAGRVFDDVHSLRVDGGRQRAIRWTLVNDPRTVDRWFSLSEVLVLGKPAADLHAWGMSGIPFESCYCSRLQPVPPWQIFTGQLNTGVLPARIADLNLRIAEMSAELKVPAVLSRGILAAAVEDYLDDVQPSDYDDWMAFVRAARRVPRERVEDYTAALTANGPLVPAADREDRQ